MSATRLTQKYILEHPAIKDCLSHGMINYSALARDICKTYKINEFDAVLMAARRYAKRLKGSPAQTRRVVELVRKAKLHVRNKIIVAIIERPRQFTKLLELQSELRAKKADLNVIEGEDFTTIITNAEHENLIRTQLKPNLKKVARDLVQISMIFDSRIETTTGVVSYVYGLLSSQGINVLEEMSCWTDLMFVLEEKDLARAVKVLSP